MKIRLREDELLRAGMPRDAVAAPRDILKVIGDGIEAGDIGDLEGLMLTTGRSSATQANLAQTVEAMSEQVATVRRDIAGQLFALRGELDALKAQRSTNLTGIERRLDQLEHLTAGL